MDTEEQVVQDEAVALELAFKSLVDFRHIYMPAPDECEPAPFHHEWSEQLLHGRKHFAVEAFRESGKALALDTEIPTPEGWKTIGDIHAGDWVYSFTGKPVLVLAESPIFEDRDCYKITFDDGSTVVCSGEHRWAVIDKHCRKNKVHTTSHMAGNFTLGKPRTIKTNGKKYQEYAYRIPCSFPIEGEEKVYDIAPYLLGLWLGDGRSDNPYIAIGKQDIEDTLNNIKKYWQNISIHNDGQNNFIVSLLGIKDKFVGLNLIKNKHIPSIYMDGSVSQRQELLQGLIDSDGTVARTGSKKGTVSFTNINKNLIDDVCSLVGSLGIKYTVTEKDAKINGVFISKCWNVNFKTNLLVSQLPRKNNTKYTQNKRSKARTIINIEREDTVPTKCIQIDEEEGLFLITRSYIATHNSVVVIRAHTMYRLVFPSLDYNFLVIIMANQTLASARLKDIVEDYLSNPKLCSNLVEVKRNNEKTFECVVKDIYGKEINVRIDAYGKGSSVRGLLHGETRPKLIIIDDPQDLEDSSSEGVLEKDYNWFLSDIIFLGKKCRIFMIGNNLGEACLIERVIANKEFLGFETQRLPVMKDGLSSWAGKYTVEFIEREREQFEKLGKIDTWYRERMCEVISPDSQLFKEEYFKYYNWNDLKLNDLNVFITIDLAISKNKTADYTAIYVVGVNKDNHWFLLDCIFGRFDPSETIDAIFKAVGKWSPQAVGIEKVAFQASMQHFLEKEMPRRNMFFTITQLKAQRRKEERISALQPRFSAGAIWTPRDAGEWWRETKSELLAFPHSLHDDLIDALAYTEQIAISPTKRSTKFKGNYYAGSM